MVSVPEEPRLLGVAQSLVRSGLLDKAKALEYQAQARLSKQGFVQYLTGNNLLTAHLIATFLSNNFGLPLLDLNAIQEEKIPFNLLNELLIRKHTILPLLKRGDQLFLAIEDPSKEEAIKDVQFYTSLRPNLVVVESDKLRKVIQNFAKKFTATGNATDANENLELAKLDIDAEGTEANVLGAQDAPIVRFVNKILADAMRRRASDIHFEPYESFYRVRYRLDGILVEVSTPPASLATRITARIKILSNLDISERRIPQDGRFNVQSPQKTTVECRVSTCPTSYGEKVVIRLLDPERISFNIDELGFDPEQKKVFLKSIHRPLGMIIVTGPTGSGKSLTLYNALNIVNTREVNICSVEDPVEIRLVGVNQVNVNNKAGLTFASSLRSFLRQDPDIIMIGEIRDLETAEIAIAAAQTGHLVLSTLHTNSAIETITRLKNMGIPSYNISSSLALMMAQRLVRVLCQECKIERTDLTPTSLMELGFTQEEAETIKVYRPGGCYLCNAGYKGRVGLYEVLPLNGDVEQLIISGASTLEIAKYYASHNFKTIHRSGLDKIYAGITTIEEVNRVTVE